LLLVTIHKHSVQHSAMIGYYTQKHLSTKHPGYIINTQTMIGQYS